MFVTLAHHQHQISSQISTTTTTTAFHKHSLILYCYLLLTFVTFIDTNAHNDVQLLDSTTLSTLSRVNTENINNGTTTSPSPPLSSSLTTQSVQNYTLRNLEPFTEYLVTLRVFNPQGDGPTATLAATTDEGSMC